MPPAAASGILELEQKAHEAARLLRLIGNENRLLILCRLVAAWEMTAGELAAAVGLSPSALSQHLAKMREDDLVATRRSAQTIYYRISDPNARRLLGFLKTIFCP
jgi:DNA-binding transcriptional ArsR family regulator